MSNMNLSVGIKTWKNNTNILTLDLPKELEMTFKTGVKWFDEAMGGQGMTPSTSMLLSGTPGAGKTTACLQISDAITAQPNSVSLYNTGEESLYQVRKVTKRVRLRHGFIAGQDTLVPRLLEHADAVKAANPDKQLFIFHDSLQTLDDGKYGNGVVNAMSQVRAIEMIANYCKDKYAIAIIIGQVNKGGEFAGKNQIRHAVDVHAHLCVDKDSKSKTWGERLFEVTKNRFGSCGRTYVLGLNETGLYEKGYYDANIVIR
jgi:predicted ATP-dependent serine protease